MIRAENFASTFFGESVLFRGNLLAQEWPKKYEKLYLASQFALDWACFKGDLSDI